VSNHSRNDAKVELVVFNILKHFTAFVFESKAEVLNNGDRTFKLEFPIVTTLECVDSLESLFVIMYLNESFFEIGKI